jgi:hypothetical protein
MLMIDKVREVVLEFAFHVAAMERPKEFIHPVADIQDRARAWSYPWSAAPGIYVFLNADAGHSISR